MHVLFVTVDAGGNLPPALGIAREAQRRGCAVTVLGHPHQRSAVEAAGLAFEPFATAAAPDPRRERSTLAGLFAFVAMASDRRIGDDAVATAARVGADVVVVDVLAFGGIQRVVAAGLRTASLVHCPDAYWSQLHRGPVGPLMRLRGIDMRAVQASPGLRLLASGPELDQVSSAPDHTRQVGVVWQGQPVAAQPASTPRVLVSLSTTAFPGQGRTLQAILDAVADLQVEADVTTGPALDPTAFRVPPNATIHAWLDHTDVLARASLLVGHGGWSTTTRALSYGVPVLVLPSHPMLDQPLVGRALARAGVGDVLRRRSTPATIGAAITRLLSDEHVRAAAADLGERIRRQDGAAVAVDALEELAAASRPTTTR